MDRRQAFQTLMSLARAGGASTARVERISLGSVVGIAAANASTDKLRGEFIGAIEALFGRVDFFDSRQKLYIDRDGRIGPPGPDDTVIKVKVPGQ